MSDLPSSLNQTTRGHSVSYIPHKRTHISQRGGHPNWGFRIWSNFNFAYISRILLVKTKTYEWPIIMNERCFCRFLKNFRSPCSILILRTKQNKTPTSWKGDMFYTLLAIISLSIWGNFQAVNLYWVSVIWIRNLKRAFPFWNRKGDLYQTSVCVCVCVMWVHMYACVCANVLFWGMKEISLMIFHIEGKLY